MASTRWRITQKTPVRAPRCLASVPASNRGLSRCCLTHRAHGAALLGQPLQVIVAGIPGGGTGRPSSPTEPSALTEIEAAPPTTPSGALVEASEPPSTGSLSGIDADPEIVSGPSLVPGALISTGPVSGFPTGSPPAVTTISPRAWTSTSPATWPRASPSSSDAAQASPVRADRRDRCLSVGADACSAGWW